MVLVGDEAQVQACFGAFRDSANLDARLFQTHLMVLLGDKAQVEAHS